MQKPGPVWGSGKPRKLSILARLLCELQQRALSQIRMECETHWKSDYVIVQTLAKDQMCGKRPSSGKNPIWQKLRCMPLLTGTKNLTRWTLNYTHPSTAPLRITTFVLPWTLLLATTHKSSQGYVPRRHNLPCQNPSQLGPWCGEHSGVCPSKFGIDPLQKHCLEYSPFWETHLRSTKYKCL